VANRIGFKCRFYGECVNTRTRDLGTCTTPTVVASLDKAHYNNYLCLVASNKQQIHWEEAKEAIGKLGNRQLLSE